MSIYWFQDEDGNDVLPFIQLKEPLRVSDNFAGFDETLSLPKTGNMDPEGNTTRREAWQNFTDNVEGELLYEDLYNLTANGTTTTLDLVNIKPDNELYLKSDNHELMIKAPFYPTSLSYYFSQWITSSGSYREGSTYYTLDGSDPQRVMEGNGTNPSYSYLNNTSSEAAIIFRDYTGDVMWYMISASNRGITLTKRYLPISDIPAVIWKSFPNTYDAPIMKEEGIVDMKDRYSPKTQTSGIGIYPLNRQQITEFTFDLWEETFTEKINKMVNGDPMKSILALRWYYGIASDIPRTEKSTYLTLGNVNFNGNMTQSSVVTKPARSEIITYSMGAITIERKFNNFLDFSPFTRIQVYIPYVGFTELEATVVMGRKIRLDYNINITTGASIAYLYVEEGMNKWRIIQEQGCVVGVDIPLSIESSDTIGSRIVTSIAGAGATAVGAGAGMMGGPIGAGAAAAGIAGGMISNSLNSVQSMSGQSSRTVGGLNSDTGSMGEFQPHVVITRPVPKAPEGYNKMVGKPDYRITKVGEMSGYIKVGSIASQNEVAPLVNGIPKEAMDEIDQLLKAGVYTR